MLEFVLQGNLVPQSDSALLGGKKGQVPSKMLTSTLSL